MNEHLHRMGVVICLIMVLFFGTFVSIFALSGHQCPPIVEALLITSFGSLMALVGVRFQWPPK